MLLWKYGGAGQNSLNVMIQSRNSFVVTFLLISILAGAFALHLTVSQRNSWGSWAGLFLGSSIGVLSCLYLEGAIRKGRRSDPADDSGRKKQNLSESSSHRMLISVVGGLVLAKLVAGTFGQQTQTLINIAVLSWIAVTFSYGAVLIWRLMR